MEIGLGNKQEKGIKLQCLALFRDDLFQTEQRRRSHFNAASAQSNLGPMWFLKRRLSSLATAPPYDSMLILWTLVSKADHSSSRVYKIDILVTR